ncbi:MAG: hypothetical protein NY202_04710 [Mollicutes bacterium UO1]
MVGGSLLNMVNTLDAIKEEINAAEIRALKDEAYQVQKDLAQASLDVKSLENQIVALRTKLANINTGTGAGSSSGSSGYTPPSTTSIRNAIVGMKNQLVTVVNSLINDMNDLNQQMSTFVTSLNVSGGASPTVRSEFSNLQSKQNNLIAQIGNLATTINSL